MKISVQKLYYGVLLASASVGKKEGSRICKEGRLGCECSVRESFIQLNEALKLGRMALQSSPELRQGKHTFVLVSKSDFEQDNSISGDNS